MNNILVLGELGTDRFVYGKIERLSPEAPVPVLMPVDVVENPGMAGNVVENLKAISPDSNIKHIHQDQQIIKTRFVERKTNHMFLRVDEGEANKCSRVNLDEIIEDVKSHSMVVLSDYDKGFLSSDDIKNIAEASNISILDSKKKLDQSVIHYLDFIKLNESEAELNKELVSLFPDKFIVTLGAKGVMYMGKMYPSPNPQETIDVSGAGDTFVASFTVKYLETKNVDESITYANEMASRVVSMRGVNTPI